MKRLIPIFLLFFFIVFLLPVTVKAYIGVSGSFSGNFTLPVGGITSGERIVIHNPGNETLRIKMEYDVHPKTPYLIVNFSEDEFTLKPKESKTVYITVRAVEGIVPGIYEVIVGGREIVEMPEKGAIAVAAGGLKAYFNITGEFAYVTIRTVDIYGNPVPCEIRLISLPSNYLINTTKTGYLHEKVVPGKYRAEAYLLGYLLNRTEFFVNAYEDKEVTLIVNTVYFRYFSVAPAVDKEGNIGYAYIVAVVSNLFKPLPNATLLLRVWFEGAFLENVTVSTVPLLPKGDSEYKYNYIPKDGWKTGTYEFQMLLYSEGKLYAFTAKKQLKVQAGKVVTGKPLTISALAGVAVFVTVVIIFLIIFFRRRRRKELLEKIYRNLKDAEETIKECSEMLKEIDETLRRW